MTPEGLELALNECGRVCAGAGGGEDEHDEGDEVITDVRRAATTSERLLRRLIEDGKEGSQDAPSPGMTTRSDERRVILVVVR